MKTTHIFFFAALAILGSQASASEYIYRDLMGNTLPPKSCAAKPDAEQRANDPYTIDKYARRFCETQGYGWYVSEKKAPGKLVCEPCGGDSATADSFRCHVEDVTVSCKRLKPGTAGLFPGKS